jgi:hypothetical protein
MVPNQTNGNLKNKLLKLLNFKEHIVKFNLSLSSRNIFYEFKHFCVNWLPFKFPHRAPGALHILLSAAETEFARDKLPLEHLSNHPNLAQATRLTLRPKRINKIIIAERESGCK